MKEIHEKLDKVLGIDYVFASDNKDDVLKAGSLLASILAVNSRLDNHNAIEWFENDIKHLEDGVKNVRKAVRELRHSEIATIEPTLDILTKS